MLIANDIDRLYKQAIKEVLSTGEIVTARGLTFKELRFQHLVLRNPRARIIQNQVRKFSQKFMAAEFIWMMRGGEDVNSISFYNKRMGNFSDDGLVLSGAYGPRLRCWHGVDQIANIIRLLKEDNNTRQAVMIILDPARDLVAKTKDVPCNDLLQLIHRNGKLHMSCYVRSNDLNWGFPYDVFHWTLLQEMVAAELGFELGEYNHFIGSMHVYDKDYESMIHVAGDDTEHVEMKPMPKGVSVVDTIDRLDVFERTYREQGQVDYCGLDGWWVNFAANIITNENSRG